MNVLERQMPSSPHSPLSRFRRRRVYSFVRAFRCGEPLLSAWEYTKRFRGLQGLRRPYIGIRSSSVGFSRALRILAAQGEPSAPQGAHRFPTVRKARGARQRAAISQGEGEGACPAQLGCVPAGASAIIPIWPTRRPRLERAQVPGGPVHWARAARHSSRTPGKQVLEIRSPDSLVLCALARFFLPNAGIFCYHLSLRLQSGRITMDSMRGISVG